MEQWHRQFFVTSFFAEDEVELRHTLGVGNMMWGSDLPHVEGTYPRSRQHLAKLFAGVPREEVEAIAAGMGKIHVGCRPAAAICNGLNPHLVTLPPERCGSVVV
jgi:hypothetical protein